MCQCMSYEYVYSQTLDKGVKYPGAGVRNGCDTHDVWDLCKRSQHC